MLHFAATATAEGVEPESAADVVSEAEWVLVQALFDDIVAELTTTIEAGGARDDRAVVVPDGRAEGPQLWDANNRFSVPWARSPPIGQGA